MRDETENGEVEGYDTYGNRKGKRMFEACCHRMPVPPSGYLLMSR